MAVYSTMGLGETLRLLHPGARGRKARWKVRHALFRKHRRRPHPMREVRRVQRFIANCDAMQKLAGAAFALCLLVLAGCELRSNPCNGGRPGIVRCRSSGTPADSPEGYRGCVGHWYPYTLIEAGPYSLPAQQCSIEWLPEDGR